MLLEATEQPHLGWGGEFLDELELTLHLKVEQDSKELQGDLLEGQMSKGPEAGRSGKSGQQLALLLLGPEESIHLFILQTFPECLLLRLIIYDL